MEAEKAELKATIKQERLRTKTEPMWFYDEVDELWHTFRTETRHLEREHLEVRTALRDATAALKASPESQTLQARVRYLTRRLDDLERQAPWIAAEVPIEVLLWGVPHG
jgi:hypothetical protein